MNAEPFYTLLPTAFHSMQEAQEITSTLEEHINDRNVGAANIRPVLVETFSELVNNAAEHGMSTAGAHAQVRFMLHRRGHAFDAVIADSAPGIRATIVRYGSAPLLCAWKVRKL